MIDNELERQVIETVRKFVQKEVLPSVTAFDQEDRYPDELLRKMGELGLFSITTPEELGGLGLGYSTVAKVIMELSQGWMSLSGAMTAQYTISHMIKLHGTEEQKAKLLPRLASGELRASFSMTEPGAGSDGQAITTFGRRVGEDYLISGQKTWATHSLNAGLVMMLVVTDKAAVPRHRGMSAFLIEKTPGEAKIPGMEIRKQKKLGFKGVESAEIFLTDFKVPASAIMGGDQGVGKGFKYTMAGLESGRLCVASSSTGMALATLKRAVAYSQQRKTFGKPIAEHQAIQIKLAGMATRTEAAKHLVLAGAKLLDEGHRADLELSMAKFFASETGVAVSLDAVRVHGGNGYAPEFMVERFLRDSIVQVLGEGSNEILQVLIAKRLPEFYGV